tara:strand:+ start:1213 stop:1473 length:261 start_codon:yes stop_codon:yes gene_type:complete
MTNSNDHKAINLHYIRAAIEANTGVRLSLAKTRQYLLEEKLITPMQAKKHAQIFRGYADYYHTDSFSKDINHEEKWEIASALKENR